MTSFSRFQERNKKRTVANNKLNTNYIFKGYPSIEIIGSADQKIQACVVNKQEQDYAYIYTHIQDELSVGSIWTAKNLHLLITEEITIIKDVDWHKYHALLCNVQVDNQWGYFIGPEESAINVALKQEVWIKSQQKPILVLPAHNTTLNFEDKIMIKNRAWMVSEYDNISSDDVIYYTLVPTTMSKNTSSIEKAPEININITEDTNIFDNIIEVAHAQQIKLSTENGFFKTSNHKIKILQRTSSQVIFMIPFGIDEEVNIQVQEKGGIVTQTYRAV